MTDTDIPSDINIIRGILEENPENGPRLNSLGFHVHDYVSNDEPICRRCGAFGPVDDWQECVDGKV